MAMTRDCKSLALRASLVRVQPPAPKSELKGAISAFFRARSINNRASREENTDLAPFIFGFPDVGVGREPLGSPC